MERLDGWGPHLNLAHAHFYRVRIRHFGSFAIERLLASPVRSAGPSLVVVPAFAPAPSHSVRRGKTPVLASDEARRLLDAIDVGGPAGLRDRVDGLFVRADRRGAGLPCGGRGRLWVRLHEKGGKRHEMPCHHNLEEYLTAYIGFPCQFPPK